MAEADRINLGSGQHLATGRALDVRDEKAFRTLVEEVASATGALDVLFNNAGISMGGPTHELTSAHWDRIIDVNLKGVVNGVLWPTDPRMMRQGHGHIVNTASGVGLVAPPYVTAYAVTKHAVVGLSTSLRPEAARHGVAVSVLCPGSVETPILDRLPDDELPSGATPPATARAYAGARTHPDACRQVRRTSAASRDTGQGDHHRAAQHTDLLVPLPRLTSPDGAGHPTDRHEGRQGARRLTTAASQCRLDSVDQRSRAVLGC